MAQNQATGDDRTYNALMNDWDTMNTETGNDPPAESSDSISGQSGTSASDHSVPAEGTNQDTKGTRCKIKELYSSDVSVCKCCISWIDHKPYIEDVEKGCKAKIERETFAIVRRQQAHGGEGGWKTHSIDINSSLLRKSLTKVFYNYPGVDLQALDLSFKPQFTPFVHRWGELCEAKNEEEDDITRAHIELLINVLEPEIDEQFRHLQHFNSTGFIEFYWLDLAFLPKEIVISESDGVLSAGELHSATLLEDREYYYDFVVDVVDWNGEQFGVKRRSWRIDLFQGSRQLATLNIFPLRIHPRRQEIYRNLVQRGGIFGRLQGQHLRYYSGDATCSVTEKHLLYGSYEKKSRRPLQGRIIIDARAYYKLQDYSIRSLRPLDCLETRYDMELIERDEYGHEHDQKGQEGRGESSPVEEALTELQCLLAVPRVKGFVLADKMWCRFDITSISDVIWNPGVLEKLVLREEEKLLLTALLAPRQSSGSKVFDDFIPKKGKGIIILLCGPPGVGKTLTAETVAEHLKQPLFRLGAGDLGTIVSDVEKNLKQALNCCAYFNAILLIDEADVFLESRSTQDLDRNELVSIFLRLLEYYEGVMILTTNRINAIDAAFESRIDITLAFDDLDQGARVQIWRNFISDLGSDNLDIDEDSINVLAKSQLNGRQIKSAVKTGCILAAKDGVSLNMQHLRMVLGIRDRATKLLNTNSN